MSQRTILKQYKEFEELTNFLTCYFGDDWEGRTEADIIAEAVQESPPGYIVTIHKQLSQFLASPLSADTKRDIVRATNVYRESGQQIVEWLTTLKRLIEEHHR